MCNGICKRLYKAKKIGPHTSLYVNNVRCTHCDTFISKKGIYMGKSNWRCRCCGYPVRHTPFSGRKSLAKDELKMKDLNKALDLEKTCSVLRKQ